MASFAQYIIYHSGREKSASAFSSSKIFVKIEEGHGKSQRPPLSYSDPLPFYQLTFEGNDRKFPSKVFIFFWPPSYQKYSIFLILTRMSDVFGVDSHERIGHSWIILGLNHSKYYFCQESTNLTGPKLSLPVPWDFIRRFFRTNDDYPNDSAANLRLSNSNQV
jgi:hypothetical protein